MAQEAFVIAYRSLGSWRADGAFGAWLSRIAVRLAVRRAGQRKQVTWLDPLAAEADQPGQDRFRTRGPPTRWIPHTPLLRSERDAQVRAAVASLDEPYREVVALRFFAERSLAEIAEATDRPLGTVKTHLHGISRACVAHSRRQIDDRVSARRGAAAVRARGAGGGLRPPSGRAGGHAGWLASSRVSRPAAGTRPSADFTDRVMAAVAKEPVAAPGRAASVALRHGAVGAFLASLRDAWRVTVSPAFPMAMRAQAMAMVLIVAGLTTGGGLVTAGALGLLAPDPSDAPTPQVASPALETPRASSDPTDTFPTAEPSLTPYGSPYIETATPEPSFDPAESSEPSETPDEAGTPGGGGSPEPGGSDPTHTPAPPSITPVPETPTPPPTPTPTPTPSDGGDHGEHGASPSPSPSHSHEPDLGPPIW